MTPAAFARSHRGRIVLAFASVYVLWGSTYLAIRYAVESIPPFVMGATRFVIAGWALYLFARMRGAARPTRQDIRTAGITGILMLGGGNAAVIWSEQYVASGLVALIVATVPLWIVLIDWLRPGGSRPRTAVGFGVAVGIAGMIILIGPGALHLDGYRVGASALVLIGGSMSWAIGTLVTRRSARLSSPLVGAALQMLAGAAAMLVMAIAFGEARAFSLAAVTARSLWAMAFLIVFGSLIGFTAYIYLLGVVSATKAATYAYVNPVVALALGWAFANEPIGIRSVIAAAVILAGVAIITITQSGAPATGEYPIPTQPGEKVRSAA